MDESDDLEAQAMFRIIRNADQIGAVLHAQLWVEANVNKILAYKTGRDWSAKVCGGQFDYVDKVRIAVAFGLFDKDLYKPLLSLAKLRNRLAHRLGYELTEKEQANFLNEIPKVYLDNLRRCLEVGDKFSSEKEPEPSNVTYPAGLQGRRAVSTDFSTGIFVLVYELWCILQDIEDKEFEELYYEDLRLEGEDD